MYEIRSGTGALMGRQAVRQRAEALVVRFKSVWPDGQFVVCERDNALYDALQAVHKARGMVELKQAMWQLAAARLALKDGGCE